jgi:hypothetical protein
MGLYEILCHECKKPFIWFSGNLDQRCPDEACVMATDKPNHSRTGCAAEGDVFERDRKASVVGRDMGL